MDSHSRDIAHDKVPGAYEVFPHFTRDFNHGGFDIKALDIKFRNMHINPSKDGINMGADNIA